MGVALDGPQRPQRRAGAAGCRRPARGSPRARGAPEPAELSARPVERAATGRRPAPGRCARPSRRPRSALASSFQVPFSMVSREIERRIPTAAKLMMSDEPPALRNGSVMPVIGTSVTTTAMLMNAWMHSQPVMPAASSAPKVSGAASATRTPEYARSSEQRDDDDRPDQPELLADLGEDEVVEGVRDGDQALPEAAPERPRRRPAPAAPGRCGSRHRADPTTGRARSGCAPSGSRAARRRSRP